MKDLNIALIAALLTLLSVSAFADETLRDLSVEQATIAAAVAAHPGNFATALTLDRADATYALGEIVRMKMTTIRDAYVTVLDVGPTGDAMVLFPYRFQPDNHLFAGRAVEFGGPGTGASIRVTPPT